MKEAWRSLIPRELLQWPKAVFFLYSSGTQINNGRRIDEISVWGTALEGMVHLGKWEDIFFPVLITKKLSI